MNRPRSFAHDSCTVSKACCDKNQGARIAVYFAPMYLGFIAPLLVFFLRTGHNQRVDAEICELLRVKNGALSKYNLALDVRAQHLQCP